MFVMPGSKAHLKPQGRTPEFGINISANPNFVVPVWANGCNIAVGGVFGTVVLGFVNAYPPNYWVSITNQAPTRGKLISFPNGGATSFILWPQQTCFLYAKNNNTWVISRPPRFLNTGGLQIFVDPVNGSDTNNDGLGTGTGAMQTITGAINLALKNFDPVGGGVGIQLANATYTSNDQFVGGLSGSFLFSLGGASGQGANVIYQGNALIKDYAAVQFHDMTFNTSAASIECAWDGIVDIATTVTFGSNPGGVHIQAEDGGQVNLDSGYTISGGSCAAHYFAQRGGRISGNNATTVTLTGSLTVSNSFYLGVTNSVGAFPGVTFSLGSFSVTGTRFTTNTGGGVNTGGGGANFFPGSVAGSATSPGWYA